LPLLWNFWAAGEFVVDSKALPRGTNMIFLGYEAMMMALEANGVIGLRLMKVAHGGVDASDEVILMVREKLEAAAEAQATVLGGGSIAAVLIGYRQRVALNARRLSRRSTN
jgi:hypothetical protein